MKNILIFSVFDDGPIVLETGKSAIKNYPFFSDYENHSGKSGNISTSKQAHGERFNSE